MSNKVVITGISGLLGSSLAHKFEQEGYVVVGTKQFGTPVPENVQSFSIYEGDITDVDFLESIFKGVDLVIHTAAKVSFDRRDKNEIYRINVKGTKAVVDACLAANTQKLIYISSVAALGRNINSSVVDEETLWEESKLNTNYAVSKYLAELEFWRGIEEGLQGFCVNPSVILGRGDLHNSSNKIFSNLFKKILFYTDGSINALDLRDVVEIVFQLNQKQVDSERYILNSESIRIKDLMLSFAESNGGKIIKASNFLVYLTWIAEGISTIFTGKRSQLTLETLKVMKSESVYDNSKIIKELSYKFIPLSQTLEYCKTYYVDKYRK